MGYLDYTFKETTRQLQKSAKGFVPSDPALFAALVSKMSDKELSAAPNSEPVLLARLERKSSDLNTRNNALIALADLRKTDRPTEAIATLQRLDAHGGAAAAIGDLGQLLTMIPAGLANSRSTLAKLAESGQQTATRRAGYAALVAADGKPDAVWFATVKDSGARATLIDSIMLQADPSVRATFQPLLLTAIEASSTPANVRTAALRALPLMGAEHAAKNFALLAGHLRDGRELTTVSRAITQLPREAWSKESAAPAAEAIVAWAQKVPAANRTAQDYVETVQVGREMAALLPAGDGVRIRRELNDLGVRVFAIKTIREAMRYDTTRLVVEAGKPFEIIFENTDMMPHNLVIMQPGAREEVGTKAQTMSPNADKQGKVYVPNDKRILLSSKLLEPGEKETLQFTAPAKPGDYEYVCTYPEHWKVMFGELVVVQDMAAFLKAEAPAPAARKAGVVSGPVCSPAAALLAQLAGRPD